MASRSGSPLIKVAGTLICLSRLCFGISLSSSKRVSGVSHEST